jgi:NAD dependent epimerase/dehydratase family enzyme
MTTHVPEFILKIMLGEMSIEILKSATVSNKKIEAAGYQFIFPTIETAVFNLHKKGTNN